MSALAAFESRTAYANAIGDQWISWSSGSIRSLGELPTIDISSGRPCIIQEDLLPPQQQQKSTSGESLAHAESQPLFGGNIGETSSAADITSHPVEDVDLELDAEVLLKRLQVMFVSYPLSVFRHLCYLASRRIGSAKHCYPTVVTAP
jgi:hypothetical protein